MFFESTGVIVETCDKLDKLDFHYHFSVISLSNKALSSNIGLIRDYSCLWYLFSCFVNTRLYATSQRHDVTLTLITNEIKF